MQTQSPFFDRLAEMMTEAAGAAAGMRREFDTVMKSALQRLLADMDLVEREEFEVVKAMVAAAREENEALRARIEAIEARFDAAE